MDEAAPRIGMSGAEAAEILGIHELSVSRLVGRGILRKAIPHRKIGLDRADVERLALERYAHKGHPYWTTTAGAAEILGVTVNRSDSSSTAGSCRRCSTRGAGTSVGTRSR
jgi:hypothetical protein